MNPNKPGYWFFFSGLAAVLVAVGAFGPRFDTDLPLSLRVSMVTLGFAGAWLSGRKIGQMQTSNF